jgi:hypothetical protein
VSEEEQVAEVSETEVAPSGDWKDNLPEDIKGHSALGPINDVENLAKAYVNASSMIGRDKIPLPGEQASAEDWAEVYNRLGRPESAESYQIDAGETPDGALVDWFKSTAHDIGLNNKQAQQLVSAYNDMAVAQAEAGPDLEMLRDQVSADLRQEYGPAFDDRLALANGLVSNFGGDEITKIELADGSLLGDNTDFIKAMVSVGEYIRDRVSEDDFAGIEKSDMSMTPIEINDKIREIEAPDSPLWSNAHPQHTAMMQERNRLYEMLYGDEAA